MSGGFLGTAVFALVIGTLSMHHSFYVRRDLPTKFDVFFIVYQ